MRMNRFPSAIFKIREIIKDISFDARAEKISQTVLKRIVSCMENVTDGRIQGKIDYPLPYILLLSFLAVLSGAEGWDNMETFSESYKTKLNGILPKYKDIGIPSHDTFRRVLGIMNPEELQRVTALFLIREVSRLKKVLGIEDNGLRHISVDGKEQNGSGRKYGTAEKIANLQTLHCYDVTNGICLYSRPIEAKTNEIPVSQEILGAMQLKNCVVTFDAMNTQKDTVKVIVGGNGHYVGGLKGNQRLFHEEVNQFFSDEELTRIRGKKANWRTCTEKAHNRTETRIYYLSTDIKWFADLSKLAGIKSFICYEIETEDLVSGKRTKERRCYISSLTDVELCADAIRSHWGIENQLHWQLDVTFSEDDNSTMDKNAFNNLSIMNKMALSLLKLIQPAQRHKIGLKGIRKKFGWDLVGQLTHVLSLLDEDQIAEALLNSKPRPQN